MVKSSSHQGKPLEQLKKGRGLIAAQKYILFNPFFFYFFTYIS